MLTKTDVERERYEAQRKAQLDYNSGISSARREGEMSGKMIGKRIGTIHTCERMLQRTETPEEQLLALSLEDLKRLAEELEKQALNRQ